jgi:Dna[CI] antecedent, DciA
MSHWTKRTPKNYDGTGVTTHRVSDLLSKVLSKIGDSYKDRPDIILASWPDVIGQKLAPMTEAVSFKDGILTVKVKNSTLHSLLTQYDKPRILNSLRHKFPSADVKNVVFRIG